MNTFLHGLTILLAGYFHEFIYTQEICSDEYCGDVPEAHYTETYDAEELHLDGIDPSYEQQIDAEWAEIYAALNALETPDSEFNNEVDKSWEFPTLHRIDLWKIGDELQVELEPGKFYTRITKATRPPVFVIPNVLADEECDYIIQSAINSGLNISKLFGADMTNERDENIDRSDIPRISEQTWLSKSNLREKIWTRLQNRVATLTEVAVYLLRSSGPIQNYVFALVDLGSAGDRHIYIQFGILGHLYCCSQHL